VALAASFNVEHCERNNNGLADRVSRVGRKQQKESKEEHDLSSQFSRSGVQKYKNVTKKEHKIFETRHKTAFVCTHKQQSVRMDAHTRTSRDAERGERAQRERATQKQEKYRYSSSNNNKTTKDCVTPFTSKGFLY
jgi:hypothetical protein